MEELIDELQTKLEFLLERQDTMVEYYGILAARFEALAGRMQYCNEKHSQSHALSIEECHSWAREIRDHIVGGTIPRKRIERNKRHSRALADIVSDFERYYVRDGRITGDCGMAHAEAYRLACEGLGIPCKVPYLKERWTTDVGSKSE